MTRITKKQLAQELERIAKTSHGDPELAHGQADVLLLRYINDERVSVAFDSIEKWYA